MRRGFVIGAALIVAGTAGSLALTRYIHGWRPDPARYPSQGIDVSSATGGIDWAAVRSQSAEFAYVVATRGIAPDDAFAANWSGAGAAGLRRGALHVLAGCADPVAQANAFNTNVPYSEDALPAAVEVTLDGCAQRPSRDALLASLGRFVGLVETHTGKPMLIRVGPGLEHRYRTSEAIARPIWSVRNYIAPDYAARPWRMWRANDARRLEGVDKPVGWDVVAP